MNFFYEFFHNEILMTAVISWLIAAFLKVIILLIISGRFDWERLLGTGGMPSTHTTPVTACATSAGLVTGFDSPIFAVALILAVVVAYDAAGIRRHAGSQARAINNLITELTDGGLFKSKNPADFFTKWNMKELQTLLGHNPLEVFVGVIIGIMVAVIVHSRFSYIFN